MTVKDLDQLDAMMDRIHALTGRAEDATVALNKAVGDVIDVIQERNQLGHDITKLMRKIRATQLKSQG